MTIPEYQRKVKFFNSLENFSHLEKQVNDFITQEEIMFVSISPISHSDNIISCFVLYDVQVKF